jgi:hypothetical protein
MSYSQTVTPGPADAMQHVRGTFATDGALAEAVNAPNSRAAQFWVWGP